MKEKIIIIGAGISEMSAGIYGGVITGRWTIRRICRDLNIEFNPHLLAPE